eukprot:scaffold90398_cov57-Phaeocystis_antarctica.AAC.3
MRPPQELIDKTLLFNIKLIRVDEADGKGGFKSSVQDKVVKRQARGARASSDSTLYRVHTRLTPHTATSRARLEREFTGKEWQHANGSTSHLLLVVALVIAALVAVLAALAAALAAACRVVGLRLDVRGELAREEGGGEGGERLLAEVGGRAVEVILGGGAVHDAHAQVGGRLGGEAVVLHVVLAVAQVGEGEGELALVRHRHLAHPLERVLHALRVVKVDEDHDHRRLGAAHRAADVPLLGVAAEEADERRRLGRQPVGHGGLRQRARREALARAVAVLLGQEARRAVEVEALRLGLELGEHLGRRGVGPPVAVRLAGDRVERGQRRVGDGLRGPLAILIVVPALRLDAARVGHLLGEEGADDGGVVVVQEEVELLQRGQLPRVAGGRRRRILVLAAATVAAATSLAHAAAVLATVAALIFVVRLAVRRAAVQCEGCEEDEVKTHRSAGFLLCAVGRASWRGG